MLNRLTVLRKAGPPKGSITECYAPRFPLAQDNKRKEKDVVAEAQYSAVIGEGFLGVPVGPAHQEPKAGDAVVRMHYLLPFEIVSVHLLVVLIGAAYLARASGRRRVTS